MASATNFSKAPPPYKKGENYEKWKQKLLIWQDYTSLEKTKQGPSLLLNLNDEAQDAVLHIPRADLKKEDGVDKILEILDGLYLKDKIQLKIEAIDNFEAYRRDPSNTITEFINEFDRRHNKMKSYGSQISEDVLGHRLLKAANLSLADEKIVIGTVSELTYESVKLKLKAILGMTTQSKVVKEEIKVEGDILYTAPGNPYRGSYQPRALGSYQPRAGFRPYRGARPPARGHQFPVNQSFVRPQLNRGRGAKALTGKNPLNQFGQVSTCAGCGSRNHWYDKCPDKTSSETYFEEQYEEVPVETDEYAGEWGYEEETFCNVVLFQTDYDVPSRIKSLVGESFDCAILDCGASKTVCGSSWLKSYTGCLSDGERSKLIYQPSSHVFKFGDGKTVKSNGLVRIPAVIGNVQVMIETDVVSEHIPLLMSKESLKKAKAEINFQDDSMEILGQHLKLIESQTGHYMLPLTRTKATLESRDEFAKVTLIAKNELTTRQKAIKLHRQFAHPTSDKLLKLLRNSGNEDKDLEEEIARITKNCKVCQEFKKPPPRPVVGLPMATRFNECVAMDLKVFKNIYLLHVIDHATRLSACAPILNKRPETIIKELFKIWIGVYGIPQRFLSDNGGEFSNESFRELCEKVNITVHTTAAESPWSNGLCERHNLVLADMITKVIEDVGCSVGLAVHWAVHAKNSLSNIHGFSPYQLVFGKNPNVPGVLVDRPPALSDETKSDIVRENLNALHKAREAFVRSENSERVRRALRHNVRTSTDNRYVTGDKVYYKRAADKNWKGPGTVLGQDGQQVLVKHGGVYVRVHPCRLSPLRKETVKAENVAENPNLTDGTMTGKESESQNVRNITNGVEASSSDDESSSDVKSDTEENEEINSSETIQGNNPTTVSTAVEEVEDSNTDIRSNVNTENEDTRKRKSDESQYMQLKKKVKVEYKKVNDPQWRKGEIFTRGGKATGKYRNCWNIVDENGVVTNVDFDKDVTEWRVAKTPVSEVESDESEDVANEDSSALSEEYPTEVIYHEMFTAETKEETLQAKLRELESWKKNCVYDEVEDIGQKCVSVRWVITPKVIDGQMKIKARLVARGFEEVPNFRTDSPTCMRESIRIVLSVIASNKWKLQSIDYKTAFLQGNLIDREVYLKPPSEFRNANKIWKLKKTVYGLADAPREWFLRLREEILKLGAKVSTYDSGVFYWYFNGKLEGILSCFVDDQLWGGSDNFVTNVIEKLRSTFDISHEHESAFKYVGVELMQDENYSIFVTQKKYIENMATVNIDGDRKKNKEGDLTTEEKRTYRGIVGQLLWVSGISRPDIAYFVCYLSTLLQKAKVKDLLRADKLVRYLKGNELKIKIPQLGDFKEHEIHSYSDSSWANLPCGGSQGGFVLFMVNRVTNACVPVMWKSFKIKRVVRSSLAAETLACIEGSESAFLISKTLSEIYGCQVPIHCITDNKSLFDAAQTTNTLADPRLKVDMAVVRQMVDRKEIVLHWKVSAEQLADCLTKEGTSSVKLQRVVSSGVINSCG